ncbi:MAG: hypothetical protein D4R67_02230 [Bacteroidetes bacterium]|nr:MAG: hypothetical protein D4R67_02230 [Bacteroidota bacterium]
MNQKSLIISLLTGLLSLLYPGTGKSQETNYTDFTIAKPLTRWWWFASEIDTNAVQYQLDWLKKNEFGGVEIAWIYPVGGDSAAKRYAWQSAGWTRSVAFAKRYANSIGLACDFTFGTLWPFGDSQVPPEDGTIFAGDTLSEATMRLTWEHPVKGRVINHLDRDALMRYAQRMISALRPALLGSYSALFCDSWEVETRKLWTKGFDQEFNSRYSYDILPLVDSLYRPGFEPVYYDYMKLLSDYVLYEFYAPFTEVAHQNNAFTRVQCGGSPTDLLTAFSLVDIPETEALLFEPSFARIPASTAVITAKPVVSAEAFTCLYGWKGWPGPGPFQKQEQIADLKLVADALFANGVNQIIWHGMPYNPKGGSNLFYVSVHVGPDAPFALELPPFNKYLERTTSFMRAGKPYTSMAIYLPLEDSWMGVEYPDSLKFPWAWGAYELRYVKAPEEIRGYQPVWINQNFLSGFTRDEAGNFFCGNARISSLYVDVEYMEFESLHWILLLAQSGMPVCLKRDPIEPGTLFSPLYDQVLSSLKSLPNVSADLHLVVTTPPLVAGANLPDFWSRETADGLYIFFANPKTRGLKYPLRYGQSLSEETVEREVTISYQGFTIHTTLSFKPYQSLLIKVTRFGEIEPVNITFTPSPPVKPGP